MLLQWSVSIACVRTRADTGTTTHRISHGMLVEQPKMICLTGRSAPCALIKALAAQQANSASLKLSPLILF